MSGRSVVVFDAVVVCFEMPYDVLRVPWSPSHTQSVNGMCFGETYLFAHLPKRIQTTITREILLLPKGQTMKQTKSKLAAIHSSLVIPRQCEIHNAALPHSVHQHIIPLFERLRAYSTVYYEHRAAGKALEASVNQARATTARTEVNLLLLNGLRDLGDESDRFGYNLTALRRAVGRDGAACCRESALPVWQSHEDSAQSGIQAKYPAKARSNIRRYSCRRRQGDTPKLEHSSSHVSQTTRASSVGHETTGMSGVYNTVAFVCPSVCAADVLFFRRGVTNDPDKSII